MTARRFRADGRSAKAKREKELIARYVADLGGETAVSFRQRRAIEQLAALEAKAERLASYGRYGLAVDATLLLTLEKTVLRLRNRLGFDQATCKPMSLHDRIMAERGNAADG